MKMLVKAMLMTFVVGAGTVQAAPALKSTTIAAISVKPMMAVRRDAFALRIEAQLVAGSNACTAAGVRVSLQQKMVGDTLHVIPKKQLPRITARNCIALYQPVVLPAAIVIRGLNSQIVEIIVHDIEELGNHMTVSDILAQDELEQGISGILRRISAIGGESTGLAIETPSGELIEIDLRTYGLEYMAESLEDSTVAVKGYVETVHGVEIKQRKVLVVESLEQL